MPPMPISAEDQALLDRLFAAFEELRCGGDDEPFWPLFDEYTATMPAELRDSLCLAFANHLGKIIEALDRDRIKGGDNPR
jgi:hypothetical protein